MKKDNTTQPETENICKNCGEKYTTKERNRVYGNNPLMAGYCSAGCYTQGIFSNQQPQASPPAAPDSKQKKFIIGYSDLTEGLIQFTSQADADFNAEEWVEVEAETIEEAFANYETAFEAWHKKQSTLSPKTAAPDSNGRFIGNVDELEAGTPGQWEAVYNTEHFPGQACIYGNDGDTDGRVIAVMDTNDETDAANIALVCSAPQLKDENEQLKEDKKELIEALEAADKMLFDLKDSYCMKDGFLKPNAANNGWDAAVEIHIQSAIQKHSTK